MKGRSSHEVPSNPPIGAHRSRPDQIRRALGGHLRRQREQQGLKRSDVARALGYQNLSKGCRRIVQWEEGRPGTVLDPAAYFAVLGLEGHDESAALARANRLQRRIEGLGHPAVDADRDLIRAHAQRFVRQVDAICNQPHLAGVRSPAMQLRVLWMGGRALSLGALVTAWTTGRLMAQDDHDEPVMLFDGAGSALSGAGRCSGVDRAGRIRSVSGSPLRFLRGGPAHPPLPECEASAWSLADAVVALGGSAPCTRFHLLDEEAQPSAEPIATYDPAERALTWSGGTRWPLGEGDAGDLRALPIYGGVSVGGGAARPLRLGPLHLGGLEDEELRHACGLRLRGGRLETGSGWFPIALDGPTPPPGVLPLVGGWLSGLVDSD